LGDFQVKKVASGLDPERLARLQVTGPCGATSVTFLIGVDAPFDFCRKSAQEMPDACAAEDCADAVRAAPRTAAGSDSP